MQFPASPKEMLMSFWRNRALIWISIRREVLGRYRGSFLGILWSLFNPLVMLGAYTFVFGAVFRARWGGAEESKTGFALILFAGLIIFNLFAECINRAPTLIFSNSNYVKKIVFPLEILPWVSLGAALFHMFISLVVWAIAYFLIEGMPHATMLFVPFFLLPLLFMILGFSWILASLGVFLRDVGQIVGILVTVSMFLSPIFYPLSAVPEEYRPFIELNPLTPAIEWLRELLYWGRVPEPGPFLVELFVGFGVFWFGFYWFQKTRKGFADVL